MALDFIVFNDLHLADKPPLGRKPGYRDEGLAMLRELVQLANEQKAHLISTGNLFHVKRGQFVSDWLKREVIETLGELQGERACLIVPGNHDMGPLALDSIDSQPLGVIFASGVAKPLVGLQGYSYPLNYNGWALVGRPYMQNRDADPSYYSLTEQETKLLGAADMPTAVIAHGSIIPPGEQRPYAAVVCTDINMAGINLLCSGHIHEDLGIVPMQDGPKRPLRVFANIGALGRTARTEANRKRTIKVLGVRMDGAGLHLDELPLESALPSDTIFDEWDDDTEVDVEEIAKFVDALSRGAGFEDFNPIERLRALRLNNDPPVQYAMRFLEEADAQAS